MTTMVATSYTPKELAARYRTKVDSILAFIRAGHLDAIDVSRPGSRRPRWRITPEAIERFEARRSSRPAPKSQRRRGKKPEGITEFF